MSDAWKNKCDFRHRVTSPLQSVEIKNAATETRAVPRTLIGGKRVCVLIYIFSCARLICSERQITFSKYVLATALTKTIKMDGSTKCIIK